MMRTERVARRRALRWKKYYVRWPEQLVLGRFRKWNQSCGCRMCQIGGHGDMLTQRMKDERRNVLSEGVE